jgi:hypothetical protein
MFHKKKKSDIDNNLLPAKPLTKEQLEVCFEIIINQSAYFEIFINNFNMISEIVALIRSSDTSVLDKWHQVMLDELINEKIPNLYRQAAHFCCTNLGDIRSGSRNTAYVQYDSTEQYLQALEVKDDDYSNYSLRSRLDNLRLICEGLIGRYINLLEATIKHNQINVNLKIDDSSFKTQYVDPVLSAIRSFNDTDSDAEKVNCYIKTIEPLQKLVNCMYILGKKVHENFLRDELTILDAKSQNDLMVHVSPRMNCN